MPEGQIDRTKPSIIVAEDTAKDVVKRLTYIDRRIHESPDSFIVSLEQIGETATSQTVDFSSRGDSVRNVGRKPADLIIEFFRNNYDRLSEYDKTTEDKIAADPDHQQLVAFMQSKKSERLQTGTMTSKHRPNLEAVPAKDLVRRSRFGIYLGRVALYHDQQQLLTQDVSTTFREARANGTTGHSIA